ncbi:unnamed protein product [Hymenolepis diminuta]|uniref:Uncharacterized protein n=1 Tax=Hymenolepis diminuta TaxID=6216 RepID=A0A564YPA1_HYMDI|nr:unnamed protein product [Hymenolepis diminuta]
MNPRKSFFLNSFQTLKEQYQRCLHKIQAKYSKRLHSFLSDIPLYAHKLRFPGLMSISILLDLSEESPLISYSQWPLVYLVKSVITNATICQSWFIKSHCVR